MEVYIIAPEGRYVSREIVNKVDKLRRSDMLYMPLVKSCCKNGFFYLHMAPIELRFFNLMTLPVGATGKKSFGWTVLIF